MFECGGCSALMFCGFGILSRLCIFVLLVLTLWWVRCILDVVWWFCSFGVRMCLVLV